MYYLIRNWCKTRLSGSRIFHFFQDSTRQEPEYSSTFENIVFNEKAFDEIEQKRSWCKEYTLWFCQYFIDLIMLYVMQSDVYM